MQWNFDDCTNIPGLTQPHKYKSICTERTTEPEEFYRFSPTEVIMQQYFAKERFTIYHKLVE